MVTLKILALRKLPLFILPLLSISIISPPAFSNQEDPAGKVLLSVTATTPSRLEEPAEETSGSLTIITEPEIEAQNPVTAPEILRDLPGVRVEESGTIGESAILTIRGTEPTHTLFLLDGIRLNSPFTGDFDPGNLLIDEIGQIEVAPNRSRSN